MLGRVALVRTDVSEELSDSFIRVFLRSVRRLLVTTSVVPSSPILVALIKEALNSSETSVLTRTTLCNIPEDTIHHYLDTVQVLTKSYLDTMLLLTKAYMDISQVLTKDYLDAVLVLTKAYMDTPQVLTKCFLDSVQPITKGRIMQLLIQNNLASHHICGECF
jgi:hypothetical protein